MGISRRILHRGGKGIESVLFPSLVQVGKGMASKAVWMDESHG